MWRLFVKIDEVLQETYTETAAIQRAHGKEINKMLALLFVTALQRGHAGLYDSSTAR